MTPKIETEMAELVARFGAGDCLDVINYMRQIASGLAERNKIDQATATAMLALAIAVVMQEHFEPMEFVETVAKSGMQTDSMLNARQSPETPNLHADAYNHVTFQHPR